MAGNFQKAVSKANQLIEQLDAEMRKAYALDTEDGKARAVRLGDMKTLCTQLRAEIRSGAPSGRIR